MRVAVLATLVWVAMAAPAAAAPEDLPLRLSDLPPGYVVDDQPGCNLALTGEEDTPPAVDRLLEPLGCDATFTRRWAPRGEPLGATEIESIVWPYEDAALAATMLEQGRALTAYAWGVPRRSLRRRPGPALGVPWTRGFATDDALVRGRSGPGFAVLWRTGTALSLVTVGARSARVAEATAFALARLQQGRILAPTPLSPADNDDLEVPLDDPGLGVPVVWLGRTAQPDPTLPPLAFDEVLAGSGPRGLRATLRYGAVTLGLWRPRGFDRFLRGRVGRLVRTQRCARVERRGGVVIIGGHADPPRRCGRRPRDVWWAYVRSDDVVVAINQPICVFCVDGGGAYASPAALKAVIAALRRR